MGSLFLKISERTSLKTSDNLYRKISFWFSVWVVLWISLFFCFFLGKLGVAFLSLAFGSRAISRRPLGDSADLRVRSLRPVPAHLQPVVSPWLSLNSEFQFPHHSNARIYISIIIVIFRVLLRPWFIWRAWSAGGHGLGTEGWATKVLVVWGKVEPPGDTPSQSTGVWSKFSERLGKGRDFEYM